MSPLIRQRIKQFNLDDIIGLDWETYYDDQYSLRKMAQTEYITSPEFESQLVAVQSSKWKKAKVMTTREFVAWAQGVNWARTGMLAHHTHFDGLIASHHFDIKPAMYFDTLSMARLLMPVHVGGSLDKVARAFGFAGKQYGNALTNVKGIRFKDFTKELLKALKIYAGDDIEQTWGVFEKMLPYTPYEELRLIDLTVKMYAQPTLLLDGPALQGLADSEAARKAEILEKYDKKDLMSNDKFAVLLCDAGVAPPTKISKTTGKETYAFSKTDQEFKDLLESDNDVVATLVAARFGIKSTIVETRAQRMADRAPIGAQPIYLNYAGAKTLRWSGGDKANWQNLSRGSLMRKAILAPPGHSLVIADLAQIEARLNAWFNGQQNIVDAFANKIDVYKLAAAMIYNKPLDKITKDERFVGKVAVLALGYGAGWQRFAEMLRIGAFGPPLPITDSLAKDIHSAWRQSNPFIVAGWRRANNYARAAFIGQTTVVDGVLRYEGTKDKGFTHGPGGVGIRYDGLVADDDGMSYVAKSRSLVKGGVTELRQRLYGGLIVENNTQFLARQVVAHQMIEIADAMKYWRQAMTTHDEIVGVVPTRYANKALATVNAIMARAPDWAPDLPLAVDAHISQAYDK